MYVRYYLGGKREEMGDGRMKEYGHLFIASRSLRLIGQWRGATTTTQSSLLAIHRRSTADYLYVLE